MQTGMACKPFFPVSCPQYVPFAARKHAQRALLPPTLSGPFMKSESPIPDDVHVFVAPLHVVILPGVLFEVIVVFQPFEQGAVLCDLLRIIALLACQGVDLPIFTACRALRPTTNTVKTTMTAVATIQNLRPN